MRIGAFCAMVLLNDVIKVAARSNLDVSPTALLATEQPQSAPTWHVTIECDFPRKAGGDGRERFSKERLSE